VLLETRHVLTNSSSLSATSNVAARFRALVVDDSMINSKVLSKMLSKLECLQIESANHRGAKALDYLQSLQALEDASF
jgi:CheY-like chemotaxis protein